MHCFASFPQSSEGVKTFIMDNCVDAPGRFTNLPDLYRQFILLHGDVHIDFTRFLHCVSTVCPHEVFRNGKGDYILSGKVLRHPEASVEEPRKFDHICG
jgi:hypothetical protein